MQDDLVETLLRDLRQSEARLEEIQRIAHVGYWDRDLDAGRIILSDESCRIFGLQPHDQVDLAQWHERWVALIHPEDRARIADAAVAALRGGPRYDVEYRVVRPGGDVRIVHSRADVTCDDSGRPRRMFGVMQDMTELRRAERELRASETRFRTFVDHATDAFFLHDDELVVVDVNAQACKSLGYGREELIGMSPRDFDVGLDEASVARVAERVGAGETVTFETLHRRKDGTVLPVEVRATRFQQGERRFRLSLARDITERRRAEHELRRSQTYLAEAQRLSHTGSFGWNASTGEITWSEETHRIFEVGRATPPTMERIVERTHPDDRAGVEATIERARRDGNDFEVEHRLLMPDGTVKHLRVVAHAVTNDAGQREFVGAIMDVTVQKRAEEERRAHLWFLESMDRINRSIQGADDLERMLGDVLDAAIAIFDCDRALLVTDLGEPDVTSFSVVAVRARPEFAGVLAPGVEYPVGEDLRVIPRVLMADGGPVQFTPGSEPPLPPEMVERFGVRSILSMPLYTKLDEPARFHHLSLEQCSSPRVWAPHEVRLFHEFGRRLGDAVSALSMIRDQRQSEVRFRALVDFAADAFMLHAPDGTVVDVNRQACESLGYSREELIGMTPPQFDADLDADALRRIAERVVAGETVTFETRHRRKDGTVFPVEVRGRRVSQGGRSFGISLSRDITERRRAEEERERLRQAQADLARISRVTMMGELTASLAHEIKQPIAAAITNANACIRWLARERPDLGEARDTAARIVRDANRAAEIIERVRSLYRKDTPQRDLVDVGEVVRETVALLRTEASRHSVSIRAELAPDLPRVAGDRVQLQQVFMNLMLNGIEAMNDLPGGVLTVEATHVPGGEALVTVNDEGVGLPEGDAAIFDAFFTTKPQGTGMGLTISRSIVEAHGGRLWATRRAGRGAAFHVALPPTESAPDDERVPA